MKQFNILLIVFCCSLMFTLQAQNTRYVDPIFPQVSVESDVEYAQNISILLGTPQLIPLEMDVYTPVGDDETERPVVIYLHTGSFLPQYFNGGITGSKIDSTAVEVCTRLAQSGYVAVSATYRAGWLPTATDPNVRTSTLLQATYRGIHDARSAIRYMRKTVAVDGNPYGIDPEKIVLWGQGSGGYLSLGAACLDEYSEISDLDKFIDTETFEPYVLEERDGGVFGLNATPLNNPNWVDYDSDFALAVNMGGALGDTSWIDGADNEWPEAAMIGFHVVTDPFAPFGDGPVIVPTTQEFVVQVQGTRTAVQVANAKGLNDGLTPVLSDTDPASAYLNAVVNALAPVPVDLSALGQSPTTLAEPHMYPFITDGLQSGPWDWWSKPLLDVVIPAVNAQLGTNFNADTLHFNGLITNPDMSAEKARAYIDTVFTYYNPRACQILQLEECAIVDTEDIIDDTLIELAVAPNPATDHVFIRSNAAYPMEAVQVYDINGRYISAQYNIDNHQYRLERGNLPAGTYLIKVKFEEGISVRKVIFR